MQAEGQNGIVADVELGIEAGIVDGITIRTAGEPTRAAVLSVGSELLLGDLTDTNATWISRRLKEQGVEVVHHLAVRDELDEFVTALNWLSERVHLVLIGGGLGPTADDLTREAVAATAGVELEYREDLAATLTKRFERMGRKMAPGNLKQAMIPVGAQAYPAAGTAPPFGMTLSEPTPTRIIALPGVPWELHQLWDAHVAAEVAALAGRRVTVTRILHVVGRGESDVAAVVEPLVDARPEATLAFLAKAHEIQVRLTVSADDRAGALAASQPLVDEVELALAGAVAGVDDEDLETVVLRMLVEAGQTVATAESATGGDIGARLARIPGASRALIGGAIVYTPGAKHDLLDVPEALIAEHGTVSEAVTGALATAARARTAADWGVAVTGVAGPATVGDLPVGTGFWALAHPDGHVEVHTQQIPGDRRQIIARLGTLGLDLLRRRLAGV